MSGVFITAEAIENGFLLNVSSIPGMAAKVYYCENEAEIGQRIIALAVAKRLTTITDCPNTGQLEMEFKPHLPPFPNAQ